MKKVKVLFLILFFAVGLTGCGQGDQEKESKLDLKNAEEIISYFKEKGLPISDTKTYTEENDTNELLGRPGGYIGKIDFIDTNVEKKLIEENSKEYGMSEEDTKNEMREGFGVENGGSLEVFDNEEDAKKRYEYVSTITKELGGMFAEYGYQQKNLYLRLSKSLTPTQAEEYEKILNELVENN
ncbi:hypothetical protein [Niallia sp. Krafla_26]|uniref:LptM family lipoprotein n=1 Tax=Niallia sp. Krafla_26 TaxID=3064703 RepID=UPI003D16F8F6